MFNSVVASLAASAAFLLSLPAAGVCNGDCNGDGTLTVDELVRIVAIALGERPVSDCATADVSGEGLVTVEEIIVATQYALGGCPPPQTLTPSPSPTPSMTDTPTRLPTRSATPTPTDTPTPTQTRTVTATPTGNRPPELTCSNVYRTYPGRPIEIQIEAFDPNHDAVRFTTGDLIPGASLDELGLFRWTPGTFQLGPFYQRFTASDSGDPQMSSQGELIFQVLPPDPCVAVDCDPARGCHSRALPIDQLCCLDVIRRRVPEPRAGCPHGRVVYAGRSGAPHFQRLKSCDAVEYIPNLQIGAFIFFDIQARCLQPGGNTRLHARMESHNPRFEDPGGPRRVLFDEERLVDLRPDDHGFLSATDLLYEIGGGGPFFDLDGAEVDFSFTLTDANGVSVSNRVRIVTIRGFLDFIPDVDGQAIPPPPGPCNGLAGP